jgi:putative ABC transport system permease protein
MVIALGTGSYAGLSNVTRWRTNSTDEGYEQLAMYDLRVRLAEASTVNEGALLEAARGLTNLEQAEERLIADIQVDASTGDRTILVPGTIYGTRSGEGLPAVNGFAIPAGRGLLEADRGQPVALLEHHFAKHYNLPAEGSLRLGGGVELDYVGQALTPEYFIVTTERGGILAEASFAAVFTSLETAQEVTGRQGAVNDLVLTLSNDVDLEAAVRELESLLDEALPSVGATVMTREEDPSFRLNKADIEGDQQIYDIFALLTFAGAVVAAFNLISRVVESQRREIGLSMALGVRPLRIAVRPLLMAAEIALLGVVFGVGVGLLIGSAMGRFLRDLQPLPEWHTPFLVDVFFIVGVLGFLLPFLATIWPVWRAVRVPPVRAIQAGYRSARGSGVAPMASWLRLPGDTFMQLPVRNVLRTPRRTALTVLGIAAALAALVAFVGLIDSFLATIDRGRQEVGWRSPNRLEVTLDRPYPVGGETVQALLGTPGAGLVEPTLRLGVVASSGDEEVALQLELLSLDSDVWTPHIEEGTKDRTTAGIYLSELAARDLDVGVGDEVTLQYPRLDEQGRFELVASTVPVLGLHPHPFRFVAYMDSNHAALFNLAGATNLIQVVPEEGTTVDSFKRSMFERAGVTSVQGVDEVAQAIEDLLSEFVIVLRVVEGAMLLLALLIAFNSASINMDERTREHATMFAFGVPLRTVLRMAVVENLVIGVCATALGGIAGWALLRVIIAIRIPETLPDVDVLPFISASTLLVAAALGVIAVALAPLLTWRRLRNMDVPAMLKVFD